MTVQEIKRDLRKHIGEYATIEYHLGRNKYEEYQVKIKELYNYVFLVEEEKENTCEIKSFSYSDILTKTIRINY